MDRFTIRKTLNLKTKDCDSEMRCHCELFDCALHDYCTKGKVRTGMIRDFCLHDCMNRLRSEVRLCPSVDCPFYPYRMSRSTKPGERLGTTEKMADSSHLKEV